MRSCCREPLAVAGRNRRARRSLAGLYRGLTALVPLLLATWFGRSADTDLYNLFAALFTLAGSLVFASFQDSALVPIVVDVQRRDPAQLPGWRAR